MPVRIPVCIRPNGFVRIINVRGRVHFLPQWMGTTMQPFRSTIARCGLSGAFWIPPLIILIQAGAAGSQQTARPAPAVPAKLRATQALYAKDCAQCHDANGAGAGSRKLFPETPDFTNAAWQEGRSDVQFKVSILEGKGTGMPGYAAKVSDHQARDLAAMVRTFAPTRKNAKENPAPSFESSFQSLQDQLAALRRDFDEASKITFVATPRETTSVGPIQKTKLVEPLEKTKSAAPVSPADSGPPGDPAVLKLYAKHCGNCHGANGTGTDESRKLFPETPDFTDASWHIRRSDGQFLASILNGKGKGMPAYREKMTEEEASDLAKY